MRDKKVHLLDQCDHFTGCYSGECRAGVSYETVIDQSRRNQMARFPCLRSLNSFTTCDRQQFTPIAKTVRRIDVSAKNWKRTIIYTPDEGAGQEPVRGLLVGCSDNQATAFIRIRTRQKHTKVVAVATAQCHFARRKKEEEAKPGSRELPLFDLREAPSRMSNETHEVAAERAA